FMLEDAQAAVLVTQGSLLDRLPQPRGGADRRIVKLDAGWPLIARQPDTPPHPRLDPRPPASALYTSRSTGTPQGGAVAHASLANKILTLGKEFGVGPDFRIALLTSSAFDPSIEQATLPLIYGGSVVVISDIIRESSQQLWEQLVRQNVNLLNCTPSYFS